MVSFPGHVLLCGDRHRAVEGRQKGLCIAEARRQGDEAWGTRKSPGAEIIKPFPKMQCLHLASSLSPWLTAACPCAPSRGLSQGCPLARGTRLLPCWV